MKLFVSTALLGVLQVGASSILIEDFRDIYVSARAGEDRPEPKKWLGSLYNGPTSPPAYNEFNQQLSISAASQDGSATASAFASQNSFLEASGFSGQMDVTASLSAEESGSNSTAAQAYSVYGVRFELLVAHSISLAATGDGFNRLSLISADNSPLVTETDFTNFSYNGELQPGIYDFTFRLNAGATRSGTERVAQAIVKDGFSSGEFTLTLEPTSTPEAGMTAVLLSLGFAGLSAMRKAARSLR